MIAMAPPGGISALNVLAGTVAGVAAGDGPDALVGSTAAATGCSPG